MSLQLSLPIVLEIFRIIDQPADEILQTATFANVVDLPSLRSLYVTPVYYTDINNNTLKLYRSIINGGLKYIEDDAFNVSSLTGLTHL